MWICFQYKDLTGSSHARTSPCSATPLIGTDSLSFKPWRPTIGTSHSLAILGSNSTIRCQFLNLPYEKNAGGLSSTHTYRLNSTCPSREAGQAHTPSLTSVPLLKAVGFMELCLTFCNLSKKRQLPCLSSCCPGLSG
jgi:hypothetical protein